MKGIGCRAWLFQTSLKLGGDFTIPVPTQHRISFCNLWSRYAPFRSEMTVMTTSPTTFPLTTYSTQLQCENYQDFVTPSCGCQFCVPVTWQVVVSLNYCSQNGGNVYRDPYYNGNPNTGPCIIGNLDQYPGEHGLLCLGPGCITIGTGESWSIRRNTTGKVGLGGPYDINF